MRDIYYEHGIAACGDPNVDGTCNVGDVVFMINWVFKAGPIPYPLMTGEANGDDRVNVGDAVYVINFYY